MPTCSAGHDSASTDFCDVCGRQLAAAPAPPTAAEAAPAAPSGGAPCPVCGEPRTGRFCEGCSYDFESGLDPAVGGWVAVVGADRALFDRTLAEGDAEDELEFPRGLVDRTIPLQGNEVRIGRRSRSADWTPEIDLAGPPTDPGISHRHAVLVARPDGGWAVRDTDSTNGTTINEDPEPITAEVPLTDGDRVHVGAWTTITFHSTSPETQAAP
jgi:hypothetical protein